jgi:hypothetical protein
MLADMFGELLAQNFERPFNEFHFRLGLLYVIIPHGFFAPARRTLDPTRVVVRAFHSHWPLSYSASRRRALPADGRRKDAAGCDPRRRSGRLHHAVVRATDLSPHAEWTNGRNHLRRKQHRLRREGKIPDDLPALNALLATFD